MRPYIALLALATTVPSAAAATCSVHGGPAPMHLVELYTSEGCSSCPPAERWLSTLLTSKTFIALEYHIDYFNDGDWRDPFSDARYTARQKRMDRLSGHDQTYTPQVFIDGRPWRKFPTPPPPEPSDAPPSPMQIDAFVGRDVEVTLNVPTDAASGERFYVALIEDGLSSKVRGGENHGKRLSHDAVVRDFAGPLELPNTSATLQLPMDIDMSKAALVGFVEDERSGRIRQALRMPLKPCAH